MENKKYEDFRNEARQLKNIILNYKKTGEPFTDPNFHPTKNILEWEVNVSSATWTRVDELYPAPLFQKDLIHQDFVQQGSIGDCYLIAALSRIAKQPYLVPSLFETATYEHILGKQEDTIDIKCGAVVIYFNCFGRRTPVLIDTCLPTNYGSLCFSRPSDHSRSPWFCLVEKAYAKLAGSFSSIVGGTMPKTFYNFFGYYPMYHIFSELPPEKIAKMSIYDRIMKYQYNGAAISTSIHLDQLPKNSLVTEAELKNKNLYPGHCYLILKARVIDGKKFICLRNPWGVTEWNGDYSDESPCWTPELKKELGWKNMDDGTFWMIEKDYLKYFTNISISKPILPEWHIRQFYVQITPGNHDGLFPSSKFSNASTAPTYAFQIIDPIKKDQKCKFYILIERRHKLVNEEEKTLLLSPAIAACFVHNGGKRIQPEIFYNFPYDYSYGYCDEIFTLKHYVVGNDDIVTIFPFRKTKCDLVEDCYCSVFCQYDFNLFEVDSPDDLIEEVETGGVFIDNFSVMHPDVAPAMKKKKKNGKDVFGLGTVTPSVFDPSRESQLGNDLNKISDDRYHLYTTFNNTNDDVDNNDDDIDNNDDEIESLKAENIKLKELLMKEKSDKESLLEEINDLKNENAKLNDSLLKKQNDFDSQIKKKDDLLTAKNKEISDLKNENAKLNDSLLKKQNDFDSKIKKKDQEISKLKKEIERLMKMLENSKKDDIKKKPSLPSKKSDVNITNDDDPFSSGSDTGDYPSLFRKAHIGYAADSNNRDKDEIDLILNDTSGLPENSTKTPESACDESLNSSTKMQKKMKPPQKKSSSKGIPSSTPSILPKLKKTKR